tara:strand:+ start:387 stop:1364 length:978 start_codon:yes stop_codon:yes gene_type:complete
MDKRKKNKFDRLDSDKDGVISEEEFEKAADELSDSGEEGIRKEELNWFMRMITLGDRFDPRDFYDRLKKSTVEFIVIFSGILLSFYVEQSWTVSEGRADRIQNLESLTAEVSEMITYTDGRIEEMKWVSETFKKQYERWDDNDPLVFVEFIEDADGDGKLGPPNDDFHVPMSIYLNRDPFDPPRATYDAIKLDGTFRLLDPKVARKMTDVYDGTDLKYLIENTDKLEQGFIDRVQDRIYNKWIKDLPFVDLDRTDFWVNNRKYIQDDKLLKYNLFKRIDLWDYQVIEQLEAYKKELLEGKKILDSVLDVRNSEFELIYWVINSKE